MDHHKRQEGDTKVIHFRLMATADLLMSPVDTEPIPFIIQGARQIEVEICFATRPPMQGMSTHYTQCVAKTKCTPETEIRSMLESLSSGRLPENSHWPEANDPASQMSRPRNEPGALRNVSHQIDTNGNFANTVSLPIRILPDQLRSYVEPIYNDLVNGLERTVTVVRWRFNTNPCTINRTDFKFSLNGTTWHYVFDVNTAYSRSFWIGMPQLEPYAKEIATMLLNGLEEPISHEMLREAWSQWPRNLRSSIILGAAAAETAIKQCIAVLLPNSGWLLENLPSPDVNKILGTYFPELKERLAGHEIILPDKEIKDQIQTGIEARNKLVHIGRIPESKNFKKARLLVNDAIMVQKYLKCVEQLLFIMDYNAGHKWAKQYITGTDPSSLTIYKSNT